MHRIDWIRRLFPLLSFVWAVALPGAAVGRSPSLPYRSAAVLSGAVYVAGAVVCHQRPERSFSVEGRRFPVCARCTGIYAGAAFVSLWLAGATGRRARSRPRLAAHDGNGWMVRAAVAAAVMPTAATLVWEWSTGNAPGNAIRALAGLPIGAVVAWIVMRTSSWRAVGVN